MVDYADILGSDTFQNIHQPKVAKSRYLNLFDYPRLKEEYGIEKFKFEAEGEYTFDFLPFPITEQHPKYIDIVRRFPEGLEPRDWFIPIWFHKVPTANGDQRFICPSKTYGRQCPMCNEKSRLFQNGGYEANKDAIKALNDTQRDFYLVRNRADNKIYVMEYSTYFFSNNLKKKLDRMAGANSTIVLANPRENGHSLHFFVDAGTLKDNKGNPIPGPITEMDFVPRAEGIEKDVLDSLPPLDKYFVEYTYEQIESFMDGTYFAESGELDDAVVEDSVTPSRPASEAAPTLPPQPQTPMMPDTPKERMLTREERRRMRQQNTQPEVNKPSCPAGGTYGADNDTMDACDSCTVYDGCLKEFESSYSF